MNGYLTILILFILFQLTKLVLRSKGEILDIFFRRSSSREKNSRGVSLTERRKFYKALVPTIQYIRWLLGILLLFSSFHFGIRYLVEYEHGITNMFSQKTRDIRNPITNESGYLHLSAKVDSLIQLVKSDTLISKPGHKNVADSLKLHQISQELEEFKQLVLTLQSSTDSSILVMNQTIQTFIDRFLESSLSGNPSVSGKTFYVLKYIIIASGLILAILLFIYLSPRWLERLFPALRSESNLTSSEANKDDANKPNKVDSHKNNGRLKSTLFKVVGTVTVTATISIALIDIERVGTFMDFSSKHSYFSNEGELVNSGFGIIPIGEIGPFPEGVDSLSSVETFSKSEKLLDSLGARVKTLIIVGGTDHNDLVNEAKSKYRSNFNLSRARAEFVKARLNVSVPIITLGRGSKFETEQKESLDRYVVIYAIIGN